MTEQMETAMSRNDLLRMTAEIVSAYVSHNDVHATELIDMIRTCVPH